MDTPTPPDGESDGALAMVATLLAVTALDAEMQRQHAAHLEEQARRPLRRLQRRLREWLSPNKQEETAG